MKKLLLSVLAISAFGVAVAASANPTTTTTTTTTATAGEFGGNCTMGLALGKEVKTDCKITWTDDATHKTYCFSSDAMKNDFAKDAKGNLTKAEEHYKNHTAANTTTTEHAHKS